MVKNEWIIFIKNLCVLGEAKHAWTSPDQRMIFEFFSDLFRKRDFYAYVSFTIVFLCVF